jgi:alpha-L-fucosidase 2
MENFKLSLRIIFVFFITFHLAEGQFFNKPERGFVSWLPARSWEEALLAGNGTIGAMVMGRPHDETIILNHGLLYLQANDPIKPIDQASRLNEIRQLLLEGKYEEATKIPVEISKEEGYDGTRWTNPFMPAFDIHLEIEPSNIVDYARSVNFQTGEATVYWEDGSGKFQRKLFVSRSDSIVVMSIKGTGKVNCRIEFAMRPYEWSQRQFVRDAIEEPKINASDHWLTYRGSFKKRWEGSMHGYEGVGKVVLKGGSISVENNQIVIKESDQVLLLVRLEPNYNWEYSLVERMKKYLNAVSSDYEVLLDRNIKVHGEMFNRVKLDLGGGEDLLLDSEVLVLKARRKVSPAIIEKLFDASRYNILCATGVNPPNLQGIWNGNWTPPWSSDFTHDGNVPVAISSFLCANMPELMLSYFNYHDRMLSYYRDNTRRLYGCRGIHIPSHTSTDGWDIHFSETWCLTFWTAAAGWAASFYYDYFLYTGDKTFLKERAYPFMKEAVLFYQDFLTIGNNGKYVFNPSYSPENNPTNSNSQACINATMDIMVAKQLLRNCIEAAKLLKKDKEQVRKWQDMLLKMPDYEVNEDGVLREWLWPGLEENYGHRHISHLYGLYELIDPDFSGNSRLILSAKRAIEKRMKVRRKENGGQMVFGLAQMSYIAANLGDSETVAELINWMAGQYWTNSLASFHNPGNLFNMDLSGGFPAAIIRALCYSESGFVFLFPALPSSWLKGSIEGILLRGQIEVKSLKWDGNDISLVFSSKIKQNITLKFPGEIASLIPRDKKLKIKRIPDSANQCVLELPEKQDVGLMISIQ